ncbi:RraA family protein [Pseudoclavibacter helvolus]|uniref:Putative 4-hydroxy-4-methyl-2-oxoglutarate aldolase n=1 Tax=Pseudoclavibacter helvolus TaxID=255205 RepID=A0A7W4UP34_9MICO|nr:RraA family protein [Pseudoclavibacter helvolus]MBB2958020.1 regulator of RNase E activity RraA [Pseudoclavibacter helvolus]
MAIVIGDSPAPLNPELVSKLARASVPTFGHYLEVGFVSPEIHRLCGAGRLVGRAVTVRLTAQDSTLLHHVVGQLEAGDFLVIDTGGDRTHAPVGEMIARAVAARGGLGVLVDGAVTDLDEIEAQGIAAYARGTSALTTKLLHLDEGGINVPVVAGGVLVRPGDVVLADRNGVFVAPAELLEPLVDEILADDDDEIDLAQQIANGARLGELTGASEAVERLTARRERA